MWSIETEERRMSKSQQPMLRVDKKLQDSETVKLSGSTHRIDQKVLHYLSMLIGLL